jgi:integrase
MARRKKRRTWGTGSLFERDGRWWIRWREHGRRCCKSFASQEVAEEALAKNLADIERDIEGLRRDRSKTPNLDTLHKEWSAGRMKTNRSSRNDISRWTTHLSRVFGKMQPHEVNAANLRRFIEAKLAAGLAPATVGNCIRQISSLFTSLREDGHADSNPVATLTKSTRKLYRSTYDVTSTPFLSRQEDIERLYRALPEPHSVIFAISAMAGLRPGEVLGLDWHDVDLEGRKIRVHQQVQRNHLTCTKSGKARLVPISNSLAPVLTQWKLATGGQGLLFKPAISAKGGRPDLGTDSTFVKPITVHKALRAALKACGLPQTLTLYQCGRHTFASQWIMAGGHLEVLAKIMGHSSTAITQHYAHLLPDFFGANAHDMVTADLSRPAGNVVPFKAREVQNGSEMATPDAPNATQNLA